MYKCDCGKEFENHKSYAIHIKHCKFYCFQHNLEYNLPKAKPKVTCPICGLSISKCCLKLHMRSHENSKDGISYKEKWLNKEHANSDTLICRYCGKECKNKSSLIQHEIRCKSNPNKLPSSKVFNKKGKTAWNKGLTKKDPRIAKGRETFTKNKKAGLHKDTSGKNNNMKKHPEYAIKISNTLKNKILQGELEPICHSRSKHGWYKGIYCDSLWELAYVIYSLEHSVNFIRNHQRFYYNYNDEQHIYIPDFYLPDSNTYVEIKGYKNGRWYAKQKQFTGNLLVIDNKSIDKYLTYVKNKYGDNFHELYDKN